MRAAAAVCCAAAAGAAAAADDGAFRAAYDRMLSNNAHLRAASPDCDTYTDCIACANATTWSGANCRWCPRSNDMACHAQGSLFNKCSSAESITSPIECPGAAGKLPHEQEPEQEKADQKQRLYEAYGAYCSLASLQAWNCTWCKRIDGRVTVHLAHYNDTMHTQVYVATMDGPPQRVVVGFRGTSETDLLQWINNVKFLPLPAPWLPSGAEVHRGFLYDYESLRDTVIPAVTAARQACDACPVHIVGHSLGGAQAVVLASELVASYGVSPYVATFGCPRVGNGDFAQWFIEHMADSVRTVNRNDIVPHVPGNTMGFRHVAREVWELSAGNYTMCDGAGEDHACSWAVPVGDYAISDHFGYYDVDVPGDDTCND